MTTPTPPLTAAQRLERDLDRDRGLLHSHALVHGDDLEHLLTSWRERGADLEKLQARVQELEAEREKYRAAIKTFGQCQAEDEAALVDERALADDLAEGLAALRRGDPALRDVDALLARHAASKGTTIPAPELTSQQVGALMAAAALSSHKDGEDTLIAVSTQGDAP